MLVGFWVVEVTGVVGEFWGEVFPVLGRDRAKAGKLIEAFFHFLAELVIGFWAAGEADDGVVGGEGLFVLEPKEGRDKLTSGQISAGAEDDHDEGRQNAIGLRGGAAGRFLAGGHEGGGGGGAHGWEQW